MKLAYDGELTGKLKSQRGDAQEVIVKSVKLAGNRTMCCLITQRLDHLMIRSQFFNG